MSEKTPTPDELRLRIAEATRLERWSEVAKYENELHALLNKDGII